MAAVHPFFQNLPEDDARVVDRLARPVRFVAGERLFEEGASADCAFFVASGRVDLSVRVPGGGERALARVGAGEVLGELALVEDHRRSASAHAVDDVETFAVARADLRALCAQYHPASLTLLRRLATLVARRVSESIGRLGAQDLASPTPSALLGEGERGIPFDVRAFAPKLALTRDFLPQDVDALLALAQPWSVERGRWLWRAGEASERCFLVVRGAVRIENEAEGMRLAVLGPGMLAGETGLLLDGPRSSSCRTVENAALLELDRAAFAQLADATRHVSFRFAEGMLRGLMEQLATAGRAMARSEHHRLANVRAFADG